LDLLDSARAVAGLPTPEFKSFDHPLIRYALRHPDLYPIINADTVRCLRPPRPPSGSIADMTGASSRERDIAPRAAAFAYSGAFLTRPTRSEGATVGSVVPGQSVRLREDAGLYRSLDRFRGVVSDEFRDPEVVRSRGVASTA
jgi:hypothetical protein